MSIVQNKKLQVWLPLLFSVVMIAGILAGYQLAGTTGGNIVPGLAPRRTVSVQELMDLIKYKYVDSLELDSIELAGLEAIVGKLDPHSTYIKPVNLAEMNADIQGNFSGIGVEYQMIEDTMNVVYVVEKGPSEAAGIKTGDQIIAVGAKSIAGQQIQGDELRKLLRGSYHSKVEVTVLRDGSPQKFTITRGNVPLPSLDAGHMVAPDVGYIRLNKFAETTYREFMDAATSLQKQGMKKMILDLRGNGGGLLEAATFIADELLEDGQLIVSTKGSHVKTRETFSSKPGIFEKGPLVILLDEFSASASEVLAGAIQDNDRGTIIGRRSFGKGLVQEQFDLTNGGAIRLTVARYYTPTGRSIQKPFNGNRADYRHEVVNRFAKPDSTKMADSSSIRFYTTKGGKKVYDGGGISPDIEVPPDSVVVQSGAWGLYSQNLLSAYSFRLFKANQASIRRFSSATEYAAKYQMPAGSFEGLLARAKADSIVVTGKLDQAQTALNLRIKALMARYVWRNDGFYQVINQDDNTFRRALAFITNP